MAGPGGAGRPVENRDRAGADSVLPNLNWVDFLFVAVTGFIAWHGLTFRTKDGETEWVHLLFGAIALLYCLWSIGHDFLGLF